MLCAALRPLVFVYTEVRTCGPPGNGSHPDPGDHDIGHRCNDPQHDLGDHESGHLGNTSHLVLWRITRCVVSSSSYMSHRYALQLWCASSTTS